MSLPRIVSQDEWRVARQALLVKEKQATRALDALAAERRRQPMVKIDAEIEPYRARMGWTVPWYSSAGNDFNLDCTGGEGFGLSVFLRNGDSVYRTYSTTARGVDRLRIDFNLLDLTPLGRQEDWEDSPDGWPQTPPYVWWRLHDEYDATLHGSGA